MDKHKKTPAYAEVARLKEIQSTTYGCYCEIVREYEAATTFSESSCFYFSN